MGRCVLHTATIPGLIGTASRGWAAACASPGTEAEFGTVGARTSRAGNPEQQLAVLFRKSPVDLVRSAKRTKPMPP